MTGPTIAVRTARLLVKRLKNPIFFTAWNASYQNECNLSLLLGVVHIKSKQKVIEKSYLHHIFSLFVVKRGNNVVSRVRN